MHVNLNFKYIFTTVQSYTRNSSVQENILNMVSRRLAGYCTFYITRASPEGVIEMLLSKYWNVVIKY